jgi:hypothetical protein
MRLAGIDVSYYTDEPELSSPSGPDGEASSTTQQSPDQSSVATTHQPSSLANKAALNVFLGGGTANGPNSANSSLEPAVRIQEACCAVRILELRSKQQVHGEGAETGATPKGQISPVGKGAYLDDDDLCCDKLIMDLMLPQVNAPKVAPLTAAFSVAGIAGAPWVTNFSKSQMICNQYL